MKERCCILVVDDDPAAQQFYDRTLAPYGHVVGARSLAEARGNIRAYRVWKAFILDRMLGDGSGLDLLPEIRTPFPTTPVLILTGHVECSVINAADDFDADLLSKPVETRRLQRWVERALGRASPGSGEHLAALREPIDSLRSLFVRKPLDVATRYSIGEVVAALKAYPMQFGNRAVNVVGNAIGQDQTNLYRHARVAERWDRVRFEAMATRPMVDGRTPSWSHFVLLASVTDDATSEELLERMFREPMPVRRLEALVQGVSVVRDTARPPAGTARSA
jgi:DNA-binding response OmpR family regulator